MAGKISLALILILSSCVCKNENISDKNILNTVEFIDNTSVVDDLSLPYKLDEVLIIWDNPSHPEILNKYGKVNRPSLAEGDMVVTIEASCTVSQKNFTKEFEFTIIASGLSIETINILDNSFTMLHIPGGKLAAGNKDIQITKDYYIAEFEVDAGLYRDIFRNNKTTGNQEGIVTNISWTDANDFCDKLSFYTGLKFRLPTESELEYALLVNKERVYNTYLWTSDRFSTQITSGENPAVKAFRGDFVTIKKGDKRDYQYSLEGRSNLSFRLAFDY